MRRRLLRILAATGLGALLTTAAPLAATETILLEINGSNQGSIQGENRSTNGTPDMIECFDYHHLIHVPITQGQVGGNPVHEPIVCTKRVDRASVNLYQALANNETLQPVTFHFYRDDPQNPGTIQEFQVITLTGALLVAIEPITHDVEDPANALLDDRERIRFIYQQITIQSPVDGGEVQIDTQAGGGA